MGSKISSLGEARCSSSNECGEPKSNELDECGGSSNEECGDQNSNADECGEPTTVPGSNDDERGDYNSNECEETPPPDSVICVVKKGVCITHQEQARKTKKVWKEWAKNERTGLFGFRQRQSTIWRCAVAGLSVPTYKATQLKGKGAS